MGVRFVGWAGGVTIPEDWNEEQEAVVRLAYYTGFRHGQDDVRQPIIDALGVAEALRND